MSSRPDVDCRDSDGCEPVLVVLAGPSGEGSTVRQVIEKSLDQFALAVESGGLTNAVEGPTDMAIKDGAPDSQLQEENPTLRLIRAICTACAAEPALNAGFDGERLKPNAEVDLAIAVDTPDGLFAPVLRQAGNLSPAQLATKLAELKSAVRSRSIAPAALKGGTITLSNFGVIGGVHAVLVVSPPQVAILGAGRIHDAVLAIDNAPEVHRVLPLSLSFDHRAVTGGEAARFMRVVLADLARAD